MVSFWNPYGFQRVYNKPIFMKRENMVLNLNPIKIF